MLVKGSARGGPVALAQHLEAEENERVRIICLHGVAARDIEGALIEMDALGACLKTHRTLYHMSINPEPGKDQEMGAGDWQFAEYAALKKMGLAGQPYIVIEHEKFGQDGVLRRHRHLVASRTDLEHMRAIRADHNYRKHEELARAIEQHLGHEKVQGAHAERKGTERPDRTPSYAEMQQTKRGAVSRDEAKGFITQLWQTTDTAGALKAALEDQGWMLARGDKATAKGQAYLMVIDPAGGLHELARRVADVKAATVHDRMAAIDAASLPSVDEACALQKTRRPQTKQHENSIEKAEAMSEPPDAPKPPANQNERGPDPPAFDNLQPLAAAKVREALLVWKAWQQPVFSYDTIRADPWTAVYLPIPDSASPRFLITAFSAASLCVDAIDSHAFGPRVPQGNDSHADNRAKAEARMAELEQILALTVAVNQNNPEYVSLATAEKPPEPVATVSALTAPDLPPTAPVASEKPIAASIERLATGIDVAAPAPHSAAVEFFDAAETFIHRTGRAARRTLEAIGDRIEMFIHFLADSFAPAPPPTRAQVEIAAKVADERAQERADIEALQANEAEYDWREMQIARSEQTEDMALTNLYGVPATREGTHIARQHAQGREDEYDRD